MSTTREIENQVAPELVDVEGACRILGGVSPRWLWGRTKDGTIPCVRLGRRVMYRICALREYAARLEREEAST